MRHDEQWLNGLQYRSDLNPLDPLYGEKVAREYYEHIMKWRSIQEPPEDGARVELANEIYSQIVVVDEVNDPFIEQCVLCDAIAWRPAAPLPKSNHAGES